MTNFRYIKGGKVLSDEETKELLDTKESEDSRDKIIRSNIGLIVKIAEEFPGRDFDELIQMGMIGLNKAIDAYDESKSNGSKFTTYAYYVIRTEMLRYVRGQGQGIFRIPQRIQRLQRRVEEAIFEIELKGLVATDERIMDFVNENYNENVDLDTISLTQRSLNLKESRLYFLDDGEDKFLKVNEPHKDFEDNLHNEELSKAVKEALNTLSPALKKVIELRFGLTGEEPKTYQEIGDILSLSRERVRQLKRLALEELSSPIDWRRRKKLEELYYEKEA